MRTETIMTFRELDARLCDGIQVRLLWSESVRRLLVAVLDIRSGEGFHLAVRDDESPLDVFHHPFAYATETRMQDRFGVELRAC